MNYALIMDVVAFAYLPAAMLSTAFTVEFH